MPLIRPVKQADLDPLVELASEATFGLTTLPADEMRLKQRIDESESGEAPLLVMIDDDANRLVGTAGLFTHVGDSESGEPFYAYRLERSIHQSEILDVRTEVDVLHLVKLFDGPTEIGTLFLHPEFRGGGNGRILSLSRFMLVARDPSRFDRQFIAEMRGVIDDQGRSPFWEGIGRHFFQVDFPIADILSSQDKKFIAELMPTHPIYVPLLPESARQSIGKVHEKTRPARAMLESEGFYFSRMVDIFDGGPGLRCDRDAIRTVNQCKQVTIARWSEPGEAESEEIIARPDWLVARADGEFRCLGAHLQIEETGVALSPRDADRLQVSLGDRLLISPSKAPTPQSPKAPQSDAMQKEKD